LVALWKNRDVMNERRWLWLLVGLTPAGFLALEAGWVVTEVGRQPWIIYKVMRTAEAVTPVTGLGWNFLVILLLYGTLGTLSFFLLWKWFRIESERGADA